MAILEIDIGNTRAKWRLRDPSVLIQADSAQPFNTVNMGAAPAMAVDTLISSLCVLPWEAVEKVWISNVRGLQFEGLLTEKLQAVSGKLAVFPKPVKHCSGVTNGYDDPSRLGVDRWLAILAAHNLSVQQSCIVDCGTTITLDLLGDAGLHLGGYIVPGVAMMKESLRNRSSVLLSGAQQLVSVKPGKNTAAAIDNGVIAMITGFIRQVLAHEMSGIAPTRLFFTGGDGLMVKDALHMHGSYHPALVLDGLQLACCAPASHGSWQ
jgi:type III pantothenate kinase